MAHQTVQADPQSVKSAEEMWAHFTVLAKYGILIVVFILLGMAVFLI